MRNEMRNTWMPPSLALLSLAACVSHVPVEGAPCPCPAGLVCCETLGRCLAQDAACPSTYPESSNQPCQRDDECTIPGEFCASWEADGVAAGPRVCRRACSAEHACFDGEICSLSPHDLAPLEDLNVARLCVSAIPAVGCEHQGCEDCDLDQFRSTYCDGNAIRGCFLATHPRCGLTCFSLIANDCGTQRCVETEREGARCEEQVFSTSPCLSMPCSLCESGPGTFFCDGNDLSVCVSLPTNDLYCGDQPCACPEICSRQAVRSCDRCVEAAGVASCSAS
jgi:hypothetical protein